MADQSYPFAQAATPVTAYSSGVRLNMVVTWVMSTCITSATMYSASMRNPSVRNTLALFGAEIPGCGSLAGSVSGISGAEQEASPFSPAVISISGWLLSSLINSLTSVHQSDSISGAGSTSPVGGIPAMSADCLYFI